MGGDWEFMEHLLVHIKTYSTVVGKVWLVFFFIFRILVLVAAAESVWGDEQSGFTCNTKQPGCENACYDKAFPVSHIRFWVMQLIFVSIPVIFYLLHSTIITDKYEEYEDGECENEDCESNKEGKEDQLKLSLTFLDKLLSINNNVDEEKLKLDYKSEMEELKLESKREKEKKLNLKCQKASEEKRLKRTTYVLSIISRTLLEVAFIFGHYWLYGFHLDLLYKCRIKPCPRLVDCFVSRPTEKTIFINFMLAIAFVSILVSLVELVVFCSELCRECSSSSSSAKTAQGRTARSSEATGID
uniref:gap junction alpha-8 protein-like n=1 Tax=Myxine glutinosa TaxID=7769 RepID=UPI00358F06CA